MSGGSAQMAELEKKHAVVAGAEMYNFTKILELRNGGETQEAEGYARATGQFGGGHRNAITARLYCGVCFFTEGGVGGAF